MSAFPQTSRRVSRVLRLGAVSPFMSLISGFNLCVQSLAAIFRYRAMI